MIDSDIIIHVPLSILLRECWVLKELTSEGLWVGRSWIDCEIMKSRFKPCSKWQCVYTNTIVLSFVVLLHGFTMFSFPSTDELSYLVVCMVFIAVFSSMETNLSALNLSQA